MNVPELKKKLKELGIPTQGLKKEELQNQLQIALDHASGVEDAGTHNVLPDGYRTVDGCQFGVKKLAPSDAEGKCR